MTPSVCNNMAGQHGLVPPSERCVQPPLTPNDGDDGAASGALHAHASAVPQHRLDMLFEQAVHLEVRVTQRVAHLLPKRSHTGTW